MERQEFKFPCVVDKDHRIGKSYGVQSTWAAVLIGPDGKIAHRWWQLDVDALRTYLEGLKELKK